MSVVLPGALSAFGWTDRVLALFSAVTHPTAVLEPARVIRVERSAAIAVFADGSERRLRPPRPPRPPAVGDWVAVADGSLHEILPQWSALTRADPSGASVQVLAANIDVGLITAPADRLSPARIERELALAWDSGAQPAVVLTKADLAEPGLEESLTERLVGADVLATSAATGTGLAELRERLRPALTAVLLGPSGAGKSTLANALVGEEVMTIGSVRDADQRGRHTTTTRQLIALPGGGVLIDTPGLRSLGLAGDVSVSAAFPDIEELARDCRFSDCRHETEPGCGVTAAVTEGRLGGARLASFRKLEKEAAAEARRSDPVLRQANLSIWKARTKAARMRDKRRDR